MSIFPFYESERVQSDQLQFPLYSDYAYDFENDCFLYRNGKTYLVSGNEAIKIWIYKALKTTRYQHLAYSDIFGSEHETLIGKVPNEQIFNLELKRYITEALMCNPYIRAVENFVFNRIKSTVIVLFDVTTIYGLIRQEHNF